MKKIGRVTQRQRSVISQLASKQSPEITADSGKRNQKENTSDTQQQSDGIDEKGRGGMS